MPPKALVSDDELSFEFFLADRLRMTVGELRERMSHAEFVYWTRWHALRAQAEELERLKAQ